MTRTLPLALALFGPGLLVGAPTATAQYVHHTFQGPSPFAWLGACTHVGDVDGDGVDDLALGASNVLPGGQIWMVSGATFQTIWGPLDGPPNAYWGENLLGLGDFDGDGVPDVANGTINELTFGDFHGEVLIHSGVDGSVIASRFHPEVSDVGVGQSLGAGFGARMWRAGDVNQDGFDDLYIGFRPPTYKVYELLGPDAEISFRTEFCPILRNAGDLDGDQVPDVIWSVLGSADLAPGTNLPGPVEVRSGATGDVLVRGGADLSATPSSIPSIAQRFGHSNCGMGDVDGDGVPDFAAAAVMGDPRCLSPNDVYGPAYIRIFSGADGHVLQQIGQTQDSSTWGCQFLHLQGKRDVNGDGVPDLLAVNYMTVFPGLAPLSHGSTRIYSGRTGTMLSTVYPTFRWKGAGLLPDLTGDGLADFYSGTPFASNPDGTTNAAGEFKIYAGFPGDADRICAQPANSSGQPASLTLDGPINLHGNLLDLFVQGAPPNEVGFFFYGPSEIALPVGDGILCAGPGNLGLQRIGGPVQLDGAGSYLLDLDNTQAPMGAGPADWNAGETWIIQFGFRDTDAATQGGAGFGFSDAMRVTWWP